MKGPHRRKILGLAAGVALAGAGRALSAARSVDEQGFVPLGGIDQWVSIRGQDAANPAMLFLHGGPAEAQSPFLEMFRPWERDFTVVNWDQRGSGKTYGRNGAATTGMTMDRMVQDAIELAEHVRRRLGKPRLVLVGQSWGAMLGLNVVKRRPDLFHAFVGTGQPVTWERTVLDREQWTREKATALGDQAVLKALDDGARLPINDVRRMLASNKWRMSAEDLAYLKRQGDFVGPPPPPKTGDVADWIAGGGFTMGRLLPEIFGFDARRLGLDYAIPVFVIEGRDDHVVSNAAAREWFDEIRAPAKDFLLIDGGHFACFTNPTVFIDAVAKRVLPLTRKA